jgi:hypothetical protein
MGKADFRPIPFTDAWYLGAAMQALVGCRGAFAASGLRTGPLCLPIGGSRSVVQQNQRLDRIQSVRQVGIECQSKLAPYAKM